MKAKRNLCFVGVYLIISPWLSYGGQICMSCSDEKDVSSCEHLTTCRDEEVCFYHQYINEMNTRRYDMGCTYPELCMKEPTGNFFGKRSDHSHSICVQCCNNTHVCNADVSCKTQNEVFSCVSCSGIENPAKCNHTVTCNLDEVCFMQKYISDSKQQLYDLGCKRSKLCVSGVQHIFGKRSSEGRHLVCESCCHNKNFCNRDIHCDHFNQKTINASCVSSNECDSNLVCSSNICQCMSTDYYWGGNLCHRTKTLNTECQHSSECQVSLRCQNSKCRCTSGKYWTGTLCVNKKTFNASCVTSNECDSNLVCSSNRCQCLSTDYYWGGNLCHRKKTVNASCVSSKECDSNLVCSSNICQCMSTDYYWGGNLCHRTKSLNTDCKHSSECQVSLNCQHSKCRCTSGKYWNGTLCVNKKGYSQSCNGFTECSDTLFCNHNQCKCDSIDYWTGAICSPRKIFNATCTSSIECVQFLRCVHHQCNCVDSEYWSGNGCSIRKSVNITCQSSDECIQSLRCTNNQCNCINSEYWSGYGCSNRKSVNTTCQSSDECLHFLRCTNNRCNCIDSEYWSGYGCSKRKSVDASCLSTDECSQTLICKDHRCYAPRECAEITHDRNGVYSIWPNGVNAVLVYCIEGWTVIQRRYNGSVNFHRSWSEYKNGFGSPYGEYWLGNDNIHLISTRGTHKISILLNNDLIANYSTFNIGDESSKYILTVSGFSGNIRDGLTVYNGMKFSTKDQDNDNITLNCATQYGAGGGWWYHHCFNSHLNFVYGHQYFRWTSVKTLTQSTMLIRNK